VLHQPWKFESSWWRAFAALFPPYKRSAPIVSIVTAARD
jgi:hypothetical protein